MNNHQLVDTFKPTAAFDQASVREVKPVTTQRIYAITKWSEEGRPQFMDGEGGWTPDIASAYVLPRAEDFKWCARNQDRRSASAITIAIHEESRTPFDMPGSNVTPFDTSAPVIAAWKDHVAIARPVDREGRIIAQAEPFAVCARTNWDDGDRQRLTSSLWRAHVYGRDEMSEADMSKIDTTEGMARIPGWHGSRRSCVDLMHRVISIAPV